VTPDERRSALEAIAKEVAVCTRCRLAQARTRAVPGEGNPETEVMFVGEGPGFNEDRQGRPFVGQAGHLLEKLLLTLGWTRDQVFIANVVKCRPPENRDPEPDEIAACAPFLTRQLEALDPAVVVTLGRYSMARFNPGAKISQVHGTYRPGTPESGAPDSLVYFLYHPAAATRDPAIEAASYRDIAGVPAALLEARARRANRDTAAGGMVVPAERTEDANIAPQRATTEPTERPAVALPATSDVATSSVAADGESVPTDQLGLF